MNVDDTQRLFYDHINSFYNDIHLSEQLIKLLRTHQCNYMLDDILKDILQHGADVAANKRQILLQFSQQRQHLHELADILEKSGQPQVAHHLRRCPNAKPPKSVRCLVTTLYTFPILYAIIIIIKCAIDISFISFTLISTSNLCLNRMNTL
ncbi:unnamed protein product [Oppiella nova]|uniref:Uncharacterized protein n=1 Tax=Oppiella nova TaxID=334625 RepID=A0A7R9M173_9ACAR|nr:unnamed protein product [Oppiella nova]CAG2168914.1 unnamed protein product [Oppiella nova]